ncbi:hypothetical protein GCM10010276_80600 [Streptomyces longisporus]|uniref:Uncharacterized protein n=1 Tax=Streptomyces longisporus TaxID=1948 RepID=A0ABN3NEG0_STRLO
MLGWDGRVGAVGAAWAGTVALSDPAARAATTATATGLDLWRRDMRMRMRKAGMEVGILRGSQAVPPWARAAVHCVGPM